MQPNPTTKERAVGKSSNPVTAPVPSVLVPPRLHAALLILHEAADYARELARPVWDFAVELQQLRAVGLTHSDLRWLVCRGLVEHAAEITADDQDSRVFRRTGNLTFTRRTCFVIAQTEARLDCPNPETPVARDELPPQQSAAARAHLLPLWDKERQELRMGELVVKQFKLPAPNQELILASFQEEGWPPRIDDPLPPQPDQDAKRRLHDTIITLNRHQKNRLIRFSGDGSGEGVRWEPCRPDADRNGTP
jgi:hypothetical protein